jgi:hypothetical protein
MGAGWREEWKTLHHWLLWWQVDPGEMRLQLDRYETAHRLATARGFGCLLAVMAAAVAAFLGADAYAPMNHVLNNFALSAMAASACYLVLGWLMLRGNRAAMAGLMALCTIDKLVSMSLWYLYQPDREKVAIYLPLSVLAWCLSLHVFYTAFRVEQCRKGIA